MIFIKCNFIRSFYQKKNFLTTVHIKEYFYDQIGIDIDDELFNGNFFCKRLVSLFLKRIKSILNTQRTKITTTPNGHVVWRSVRWLQLLFDVCSVDEFIVKEDRSGPAS